MLPVLKASAAGEVRFSDIIERVANQLQLTPEERTELLSSGRKTLLGTRVYWAKRYIEKAGLVESTRWGCLQITDRGRQALASQLDRIDNAYLSQFPEFREYREARGRSAPDDATEPSAQPLDPALGNQTPDELIRAAHTQIEAALAQELLDRIRAAPPAFFEQLIVNLLLKMGYGGSAADAGRALGRSGDDGVDGVIDQDALGLDRVYVQAKRYAESNKVGAGAIRDFFGSLDRHKANKGLFVTTSTFSPAARETAEFLSKRIVLIDGPQLAKLMIRHSVGCRVEETLYIKKVDEDFFE
nr:restriction endonuclease [Geminicoccus harenae]